MCNACDLAPQSGGLTFPPASRFELAEVCKPRSDGGFLERKGVTEVVSSLTRDGRDVPHHLAMGTYVVIESESAYARQCLVEYNCLPDRSGRYAALYRPTHMIGLELGISVASVALRGEPTGAPGWIGRRLFFLGAGRRKSRNFPPLRRRPAISCTFVKPGTSGWASNTR